MLLRDEPELAKKVRVIETLGPSTIQPVVAARRLSRLVKAKLRRALLSLAGDPAAREPLAAAQVERFVPVRDRHYDEGGCRHRQDPRSGDPARRVGQLGRRRCRDSSTQNR